MVEVCSTLRTELVQNSSQKNKFKEPLVCEEVAEGEINGKEEDDVGEINSKEEDDLGEGEEVEEGEINSEDEIYFDAE